MEGLSRLLRLARLGVTTLLYAMSGLAPRSARRWVFGTGGDVFAGNPKYLFLWISIHRPDIEATWITGSDKVRRLLAGRGLRVRRRWSVGGIIATLRARVFVFANGLGDINPGLSRGAYHVNLWHGIGLKTTFLGYKGASAEFSAKQLSSALGRLKARIFAPADIVATTSDFMQAHFAEQFRLPPERCPQLGYPRLDCIADAPLDRTARAIDASLGFRLNSGDFREIYIYMPTYRDTGRPFVREALPDLARLSRVLADRGALLYVKLHPRTGEAVGEEHSNIRSWPADVDFHTYLTDFTGLITDYSSVLYDYLFVKKTGALLYTFDFADYTSGDRTLLYPFDENVAGLRIASFDALCDALRDGSALAEPAAAERVRDRFWGGSPLPSAPAVIAFVERSVSNSGTKRRPQANPH